MTVSKSQATIDSLKLALNAGSELIELRTLERDAKVKEAELWSKRFENFEKLSEAEKKQAKRKGFKIGVIVGSVPPLVLLVLLL